MDDHDHDESKITAQDPDSNVGELVDRIHKLKLHSDIRKIIAAIATNSAGTEADFYKENIGDVGAALIGEGLRNNVTLQTLRLWENNISDAGAAAIGEGLSKKCTLRVLHLSENKISDGAAGIGEGLSKNCTLRELYLGDNKISDAGAAGIGEGLSKNCTLRVLRLDGNKIGDVGAAGIGEGLSKNCTLQDLYLSYNNISDVGAASIGEGLSDNITLQKLDIDGNKITCTGHLVLAKGFRLNENMTGLDASPEGSNYTYTNVIKEIGHGEFGSVSLASTDDGLEVVEKTSHGKGSREETYERLILQGLPEHKNVVRVAAFSFDDSLLLEAHKGGSLKQYAGAQEDGSPLPQFLSYSHGMCKAIEHLHMHGVIHRDIALRNYVLTENLETAVLVDFGLSWPIAKEKYVQIRPKEMMPFRQCAPEVLSALRYSKASDIWQLGLSMWQLLHRGRQPFFQFVNGQELVQYLNKKMVQQKEDIPLSFKKNGAWQILISTVKQIVVFCCQYDSDKRPTATQVLKKLGSLLESADGEDEEEEKVVSKYKPSENDIDGGLMAYNYTDYQNLKSDGQSNYIDLNKDLEHANEELKLVPEVDVEQEDGDQENEELEMVAEVDVEQEAEDPEGEELKMVEVDVGQEAAEQENEGLEMVREVELEQEGGDQEGEELKIVPEVDVEQGDDDHEHEYQALETLPSME